MADTQDAIDDASAQETLNDDANSRETLSTSETLGRSPFHFTCTLVHLRV